MVVMNIVKKSLAILTLTRPVNCLITFASVIVAAYLAHENHIHFTTVIFAAVSAALTTAAGNVINDICDLKSDIVNKPNRPLPAGILMVKEAVIIYAILLIAALLISLFINILSFAIVLTANILLLFYSYSGKRVILLGNLTVSVLTGLVFIYGGAVVGNIKGGVFPAVFALIINLIREIIKDIEDVKGDRLNGVITFPAKYGIENSRLLITFLTALLILFTIYPFASGIYAVEYFIVIMIIVNPLMVYISKELYKPKEFINLNRLSFLLKLNMGFGLLSLYLGK